MAAMVVGVQTPRLCEAPLYELNSTLSPLIQWDQRFPLTPDTLSATLPPVPLSTLLPSPFVEFVLSSPPYVS